MQKHDWGWFDCSLSALLGFQTLHFINTTVKPGPMRKNPWDLHFHKFTGPAYHMEYSYNLLAGYAVETIIKCCLDRSGWKNNYQNTHDLNKLANELAEKWGLELPYEFNDHLKEFTQCILWKAKYPVPKLGERIQEDNLSMGPHIFERVRTVWSFFHNALRERDPVLACNNLRSYCNDANIKFRKDLSLFDCFEEVAKDKIMGVSKILSNL